VTIVHIALLVLVAVTPILLFIDNLFAAGAIQLCAAVGMTIVAIPAALKAATKIRMGVIHGRIGIARNICLS